MLASHSSLSNKAFGERAATELVVASRSHQDALQFLSAALSRPNGIAVLQGPSGSGKTTIVTEVTEQVGWASRDAAVALFDGADLTPRRLLTGILSQFDIQATSQRDEQLLQFLNNFLIQQTRDGRVPVLIVDNADRATPSALRLLNWLAALDARGRYALRIVLSGKERLSTLLRSDGMRSLARRHPAQYCLNPLTVRETVIYLRTRLIAAGAEGSAKVFPVEVCEKLHDASNGWPGKLNQLALEFLDRTAGSQAIRPLPRITVTRDGATVDTIELADRQYVIGRTELADIVVEDSYVSKMHAMLQVYSNAVVLIDLNSTNGTTVNSRTVLKTVLRDGDVISMGHYRLKIEDVPAIDAEMEQRIKGADTVTMQTLVDMRRSRARRTIKALQSK